MSVGGVNSAEGARTEESYWLFVIGRVVNI